MFPVITSTEHGTYLMSASLLVIGIGIGALGNNSRWTNAVSVTFGNQHLSLQRHNIKPIAKHHSWS